MADIKWIKITTDIFDDEKIKIIDTMPARDEILVVWFEDCFRTFEPIPQVKKRTRFTYDLRMFR